MKTSLKADLALIGVTFFWGATYALTKMAVERIQPLNLISLRFSIAFLAAMPVFWQRMKKVDRQTMRYSFLLSIVLLLTFVSMTYGVKYTSASNAAFLAGLTVIFIALASFLFLGKKLDGKTWFCVLLSLVGVGLLTMSEDLKLNMGIGDLLSLLVAVLYAVYVLLMDRYTRKVDSVLLGVLQLGVVGLMSTVASLTMESYVLPSDMKSISVILMLSIFCTALAYIVQSVAQKYTAPTHTGIILSLETVFSGIFAYLILGEVLQPLNYLGAFLLISVILIMEIDFKVLRADKK